MGDARGRGRGSWRPFRRFWGRGRGRGGGAALNTDEDEAPPEAGPTTSDSERGLMPPPAIVAGAPRGRGRGRLPFAPPQPPPKRRRTTLTRIREEILDRWKKKLPGYRLYYPDSPPQLSLVDDKIQGILSYLQRNKYFVMGRVISIDLMEYFEVNCHRLLLDEEFKNKWPEFLKDLLEEPEEVVKLWGVVMHRCLTEILPQIDEDDKTAHRKEFNIEFDDSCYAQNGLVVAVGRVSAGLMLTEPVVPLAKINTFHLGKFVTIMGQIVGTGSLRAVCLQMPFYCKICEDEFLVDQPYGMFTFPSKCGCCEECTNTKAFESKETSDKILMMDSRRVKLQDTCNLEHEKGAVPKTIECELNNGLAHLCSTGDTVTMTGVVKMKREVVKDRRKEQNLHNLYIETIAMKNHRESERTAGGHNFTLSDKDYCAIGEIFDCKNLFKLMVASFCPSIYGNEYVKAALVLSLFGGSDRSGDVLTRRSDINVLMIGDPGLGKSQMLKAASGIAPRGVYVCGTGSSVAGLTVTLVKDGDEYALEAGALVMADKGVCCIDEFDKMADQHPALLETMEQQSVSIAKSGVFRTLPARATVIAAANPVGGHYDQRKSLSENIKISQPVLSRFDVTFILLDKPDKDFDRRIVEHVMGTHTKSDSPETIAEEGRVREDSEGSIPIPLIERLKVSKNEKLDLIPHVLIRKFVAYARQYVRPELSPEAIEVLKEYYLRLRVKHRRRDTIPITTRQLESLVRLTEARAKVELRMTATANDARDVLEIFEASLSSAFDDEVIAVSALSDSIVLSQVPSGKSQSFRTQVKRLLAELHKVAQRNQQSTFTASEINESIRFLCLTASSEQLISTLNFDGSLLLKGGGHYQLLSVDF